MTTPSISVMVVDDSAVVRQVVTGLLDAEPDIRVTRRFADPIPGDDPYEDAMA